MSPSAWIAFAGLASTVFIQCVVLAFMLGRLFQRVSTLEKGNDTLARLDSTVTRMDVNMGHMVSSIDELKGRLESAPPPPSRRRSAS